LIALDSIQALRTSEPAYFELLELFNTETLDDYADFKESHDTFLDDRGLDDQILYRKIRLLTLASLAASTPSRSLPYAHIAKALKVPSEDVEMWVIDVIRAGLVEGKLSQLDETFLIHRSTYRVFGDKQWREVATRLETWKESLRGVLEVVKKERISMQSGSGAGERREAEGRNPRGRGRMDIDVGGD
jgi:translation initiation factor 3 subunit M